MMDQFTLLRVFVAIADNGSLAAAARALSLSPPVVTVALQRLEEVARAPLVIRTTRRLSLTPEGERFLADARRILADLQGALDAVADRGTLRGDIRITATNDFGRNTLAPLIDGFMRDNSEVRVALMLSDSVIDLAEGGYDLALRMGPPGADDDSHRLLVRGARKVCAAPGYWQRNGMPKHPRDLAAHNCMVLARPDAPQSSWPFREKTRLFSVHVSGDRTANEGATLRAWAIAGAGVALKSSIDIRDDLATGRLVPVLEDFEPDENNLYAVFAPGRRAPRRVRALVDYLAARL